MNITVVLPAYNEEDNLTPLIEQIDEVMKRTPHQVRFVIVNDGSTDGTARELVALQRRFPSLECVTHPVNRGFARALKTGIAHACSGSFDAAVFLDSDLSHRPADLPGLVRALDDGADVAVGSRFVSGGGMEGVPLWRAAISRAGNAFGRRFLRVPIRDLTTGYRAVKRRVLETVVLGEDGFTIQLESVIKAYAAGFRVAEVPIVLGTRMRGVSHMTYNVRLFRDYWKLLWSCRRWLRGQ